MVWRSRSIAYSAWFPLRIARAKARTWLRNGEAPASGIVAADAAPVAPSMKLKLPPGSWPMVFRATGQFVALNTMGQDPGGSLSFIDGATGAASAATIPDAGASPFLNQVRAFARAIRSGNHAEYAIERDLHTMRLLTQAYAEADAPARAVPMAARGAA